MPVMQQVGDTKNDATAGVVAGGFVVLASAEDRMVSERRWDRAIRAVAGDAQYRVTDAPSTTWSMAACFTRRNGSAVPIVADPETGSWLAIAGTWFHNSGTKQADYILQRYLQLGPERLALEMDGFFGIIVADGRTRQVVAITDVVGSLHMYYRRWPAAVALSTSSLFLASLEPVTLDAVGCQEFIQTGVIYEDRTFYNEVRKLPPATISVFANGGLNSQRRYWRPSDLVPESLRAEEATDRVWEQLSSAVRRVSREFSSIACDLTGGYDSRVITAALLAHNKAFTTVVSGVADSGDVSVSSKLSAKLGVAHLHYPPTVGRVAFDNLEPLLELTDGECDLVAYYDVARIHSDLSGRFDISLNGSFGEVARGYWWELLCPHTGARRKIDSEKLAIRRYAATSCGELFRHSCRIDLATHIREVIERTIIGLEHHPNTFQMDTVYLDMRMQRWQGRLASSTNRIWPCLSPFIFRPVLETMLQSCSEVRKRSLLVRMMLAKYAEPIGAFPLETGHPALPATWRTIPKFRGILPYLAGRAVGKIGSRFVQPHPDIQQKIRAELAQSEAVREILTPKHMRSMAMLDEAAVTKFLRRAQDLPFTAGPEWSRLLTLELALARSAAGIGDHSGGVLPERAAAVSSK